MRSRERCAGGRGFGFVTYEDPATIDKVMMGAQTHTLMGKQIEVKRAVPRDQMTQSAPRGKGPFDPMLGRSVGQIPAKIFCGGLSSGARNLLLAPPWHRRERAGRGRAQRGRVSRLLFQVWNGGGPLQ